MASRVSAASLLALLLCGCKGDKPPPVAPDAGAPSSVVAIPTESIDGGGGPSAPRVAALASPTPIFSAPEWPPRDPSKAEGDRIGVIHLGYLRTGQTVAVKPTIVKKPNCAEGWFELVDGGFVCGKYATLDLTSEAVTDAPHPPMMDGPLPYQYGLNLTNGTPLYNRMPKNRKERDRYESALGQRQPEDPTAQGAEETPWYLRDHKGARPQVTFEEMKRERGPVEQRIVRGFYLALDKELKNRSGKWWRTTRSLFVPAEQVLVHEPTTEFEGVQIGSPGETRILPIGFVLGLHAHKYTLTFDPGHVVGEPSELDKSRRGEKLPRFAILGMTEKKAYVDKHDFLETADGPWIREVDVTMTRPGPPPPDLKPGEKWIDVNLATQTLVAFEGDRAVYATLISSGKHDDDDPTKNHKTARGSFRIREKHISSTMDDDSASDGPYSIQDVPWIMYFHGGYALHGAFWHSAFGHEKSHGCVNLTPHDAKALFQWAGPRLPTGWHGVHETDANPGTRVVVHE